MNSLAGRIEKNDCGRWEFADYELTSGDFVEIKFRQGWMRGHIEYDHKIKNYVLCVPVTENGDAVVLLFPGMEARK